MTAVRYPWPLDPEQTVGRTDVSDFTAAAMREVGVPVQYLGGERFSVPSTHRAAFVKAYEIAYLTFGIDFELIDEDEYIERRIALAPPRGFSGSGHRIIYTGRAKRAWLKRHLEAVL